jgi:hypothetical protein
MLNPRWMRVMLILAMTFGIALLGCSDDEDVNGPDSPVYPADAIVAAKVATPPTANANVDALWANVEGIDIPTEVAAYDIVVDGHDIWWDEYEGNTADLVLKSVFTDTDIYFLATWNDTADSRTRQAWYNDIANGNDEWLQMGKKYPDKFGHAPAYEDKLTMFWNMSIPNFENTGCGPLCHGQYMGTNGPGELADIWHWKRNRTAPVSQLDDKWLNDDTNGRHGDTGTGAYSSNTHDLVITGGATVSAPIYWIPGRTNYHWILQSEIDDDTAREIVDLNGDNDWVDEDGTVLERALFGFDSDLVIPSLMGIKPGTGSRGEVSVWENWADGEWTVKIRRSRATSTIEEDVQFTELGVPYWFSVGIMNGAAIAHSTPNGFSGTAYQLILSE